MKHILYIFFFLYQLNIFAQKQPIKFGQIEKSDLEIKVYDKDTSAEALVLCSYGSFDAENITFTWLLRIKVFKKNAYYMVNKGFMVNRESSNRPQASLKGKTYNLVNGEIIEDKLKSESIFKTYYDSNHDIIRIAMPNVKEGSIIEISYFTPGIFSEWKFQDIIPVKWSELRLPTSIYFNFSKIFFGYERLAETSETRWVAKDVPALKEEPYTNNIDNYLTKFEIELSNISIPGYLYKSYNSSWEAVSNYYLEHSRFVENLNLVTCLNKYVKKINDSCKTDKKKLQAAHNVIKYVKWDKTNSVFISDQSLCSSYNKNLGKSADINAMLILLLRKLEFTVFPVILSTRDNGILSPAFPTVDKFNHLIACVKKDSITYLMDATEQYLPYDILPVRCLNGEGRLFENSKSDWIDIKTDKKDKKTIYTIIEQTNNGKYKGNVIFTRTEYNAFNFRKKYKEFNEEKEYIHYLEKEYPELNIKNYKILNIDSIDLPVKDQYEFELKNMETENDLIYLNPILMERTKENPFKLEKRIYPVDFSYPLEESQRITVIIPENYTISEMPQTLNIKLSNDGGYFIYKIQQDDGKIQLYYNLTLTKTVFLPGEYDELKEFFNQVIKKQSEIIVFKKNK